MASPATSSSRSPSHVHIVNCADCEFGYLARAVDARGLQVWRGVEVDLQTELVVVLVGQYVCGAPVAEHRGEPSELEERHFRSFEDG